MTKPTVGSSSAPQPPPILTSTEITQLAAFYSTLKLTGDQQDRIAHNFIEASKEEKELISRIYCNLFSDPTFLMRLKEKMNRAAWKGHSEPPALLLDEEDSETDDDTHAGEAGYLHQRKNRKRNAKHLPQQLRLANAIEENAPRLVGDGPFAIKFGLVLSEEDRTAVVNLYKTQFTHPDAHTLSKMVTIPRSQSTRTRKNVNGSYTWYLRCMPTNEVVCCVTALVHTIEHETKLVEVPLFATASGYKKNGFAKLLNAAMMQFCLDHVGCPVVVVSADPKAVPFWTHLGFQEMSRGDKKRIEYTYEHKFFKFQDAKTMTISLEEMKKKREEKRMEMWRQRGGSGRQDTPVVLCDRGDAAGHRTRNGLCGNDAAVVVDADAAADDDGDRADAVDEDDSVVLEIMAAMPRFLLDGSTKLPHTLV